MVGAEVASGSGVGVGSSVAVGASGCSPLGISVGFDSDGCAVGGFLVWTAV